MLTWLVLNFSGWYSTWYGRWTPMFIKFIYCYFLSKYGSKDSTLTKLETKYH